MVWPLIKVDLGRAVLNRDVREHAEHPLFNSYRLPKGPGALTRRLGRAFVRSPKAPAPTTVERTGSVPRVGADGLPYDQHRAATGARCTEPDCRRSCDSAARDFAASTKWHAKEPAQTNVTRQAMAVEISQVSLPVEPTRNRKGVKS